MSRTIDILILLVGALAILWAIVAKHPFWGEVLLAVIMFALFSKKYPDKGLAFLFFKFTSRSATDEEVETFVTGKLSQNELDRQAAYELARPERERIAREREERWRKSLLGRFVTEPLRRWFDKVYDTQRTAIAAHTLSDLEARAAKGDAALQYKVGLLHEEGMGTQQDIPTAVEWYRKAAAQGHPDAVERLAVLDRQ